MTLQIRADDRAKIPGALRFFRICAYVTGVFLLLLCVEMILKYVPWGGAYGYEVYAFGDQGLLALIPSVEDQGEVAGINLSIGVLIVHGWLYVAYLIADYRLWSLMRWPFIRFITIALGGVIPFLSFFMEHRVTKQVWQELAAHKEA